jgi:outer membrane protein, adhesin transport system
MQRNHILKTLLAATAIIAVPFALHAERLELKTAVEVAMQTHPEINQAVENKAAIEFEREQAQGLFLP